MQGVGQEGAGPGDKPRAREQLKGWHLACCLEEEATQSNRAGSSGSWKTEEPRYRAICGVLGGSLYFQKAGGGAVWLQG